MTNAPYSSGLSDPDRGDQGGAYAADQDPSYTQPVPEQTYAAPVEPGYSYPPVEPTYADPVTTDPWTESSETSTKDVAKDEAANVAGTAAGEGKAVAGTAANEGKAVAGTAVEEGKAVAGTAVDAVKNVAGTAKAEAANVAAEVGQQVKTLFSTATSELRSQAGTQQGRLASTLRGYADELKGIADGSSPEPGVMSDLVQQASTKSNEIVQWLENREPADVLADVRRFAARRPGMFLALCGLAGVVAGRITRGAVAANTSVDSPEPGRALGSDSSYLSSPGYTAASEYPAVPAYSTTPGYVGGTSTGGYTTGTLGSDYTDTNTAPGPDYTDTNTAPGSDYTGAVPGPDYTAGTAR